MLDIDLEFRKGMLFIRLSGILNDKNAIKLDDCLYDMIFEKELKYFIINLNDLEYIDEKGLELIINRYFDIVLKDGKLVICGLNKMIKKNKLYNMFSTIEHTSNELLAIDLINI